MTLKKYKNITTLFAATNLIFAISFLANGPFESSLVNYFIGIIYFIASAVSFVSRFYLGSRNILRFISIFQIFLYLLFFLYSIAALLGGRDPFSYSVQNGAPLFLFLIFLVVYGVIALLLSAHSFVGIWLSRLQVEASNLSTTTEEFPETPENIKVIRTYKKLLLAGSLWSLLMFPAFFYSAVQNSEGSDVEGWAMSIIILSLIALQFVVFTVFQRVKIQTAILNKRILLIISLLAVLPILTLPASLLGVFSFFKLNKIKKT